MTRRDGPVRDVRDGRWGVRGLHLERPDVRRPGGHFAGDSLLEFGDYAAAADKAGTFLLEDMVAMFGATAKVLEKGLEVLRSLL